MVGFVVKLISLSLGLAIAIKYGGPSLPIPASTGSALVMVCLPSLLLGMVFIWRWQQEIRGREIKS